MYPPARIAQPELTSRSAIETSGAILQAFCETMMQRTGMLVSVLMCGPVPSKGGEIQLRRCAVFIPPCPRY